VLKCSAMAMASRGIESVTPTQKRRVMSRNSGLSVSPAAGVIGSSAMPQIGQLPGSLRTICGCIGQVHKTSPAGTAGQGGVARRIGGERFPAARATEDIAVAGMLGTVAGRGRVDGHSAHGIARRRRLRRLVLRTGYVFGRGHQDQSLPNSFLRWKVYMAQHSRAGSLP
jgi:hypothetical protein